jgi:uncharacterized membrane protein YqaE (UPF0057 family)
MKKQFTSVLLAVVVGILLSSCSNLSKMSLTKRHYRSGYYVDFGGKSNPSPIQPAITGLAVKQKFQPPASVAVKPERPVVTSASKATLGKYQATQKKPVFQNGKINDIKTVGYTSSRPNDFPQFNSASHDINGEAGHEVRAQVNVNVSYAVIIICAIFIPPLGVGLMYGINSYFWIDLILTLLFFFPGMIFALVVVLM